MGTALSPQLEAVLRIDQERINRLQEAAATRTENILRVRAIERKSRRVLNVKRSQPMNKRLRKAIAGFKSLATVCQTPEYQSLFTARGSALSLWSGHLHIAGSHDSGPMTVWFQMSLYPSCMVIQDHTIWGNKEDLQTKTFIVLPYTTDPFILHMKLRHIVRPLCNVAADTRDFHTIGNCSTDADPITILFQVLVDCNDHKKLEKYLLQAL
jgi:hypothetical protein